MQQASKSAALALLLVGAFASTPALGHEVVETEPFATSAIADDKLGAIAGREDTGQHAIAAQTAGVANNSVGDNVRTGDASIDGNAFQNLSGLSILNVNTGNNVAINAAMNVNIAIIPQP